MPRIIIICDTCATFFNFSTILGYPARLRGDKRRRPTSREAILHDPDLTDLMGAAQPITAVGKPTDPPQILLWALRSYSSPAIHSSAIE